MTPLAEARGTTSLAACPWRLSGCQVSLTEWSAKTAPRGPPVFSQRTVNGDPYQNGASVQVRKADEAGEGEGPLGLVNTPPRSVGQTNWGGAKGG